MDTSCLALTEEKACSSRSGDPNLLFARERFVRERGIDSGHAFLLRPFVELDESREQFAGSMDILSFRITG